QMSLARKDLRANFQDFDDQGYMLRRIMAKGSTPHVCVIGAGMAGLRCAQVLTEKGIRVTILEARDRTGGRVGSPRSDMYRMLNLTARSDAPNWIHGVNQNPMTRLAKEVKATTFSLSEPLLLVYDEFGLPLDKEKAVEHWALFWTMVGSAFKYSNANTESIPPDKSLLDFFHSELNELGKSESDTRLTLQIARMWGDIVGDPIEKQSLKYFWLEENVDDGKYNALYPNPWSASTYQAILQKVTKDTLSKATIRYSTVVTSVSSHLEPSTSRPSVTITTAAKSTYTFDEAIVTAPLGWLKRNLAAFSPPLPTRLQTSIDNISYGALEKAYLTFPTAFWHPGDPSNGEEDQPPFFFQWLAPTYTPNDWNIRNIQCASLASLPPPYNSPTLLFYMHGPAAAHAVSLATHPDSSFSLLDDFFKPFYSRLPNYSDSAECRPTDIEATSWQKDEFAGWGSYSNFQVSGPGAGVELDKDIEALRKGMPERGVWFAGEHTGPFFGLGTVAGAWWSGERVAERMAKLYERGEDGRSAGVEALVEDGAAEELNGMVNRVEK
ncbi:MAG: hypothetical protein Q9214_002983, partial [Letrouitia sp. 1 TL-2023]